MKPTLMLSFVSFSELEPLFFEQPVNAKAAIIATAASTTPLFIFIYTPLKPKRFTLAELKNDSMSERNSIFWRHGIYDGKTFYAQAGLTQLFAAVLEALLYDDACALHCSAGLVDQINEPRKRTAVCKKIIDKKHLVFLCQVFF